MSDKTRIYLDNAATSFPKPDSVYTAVDVYNRQMGVAVGRGAYQQALDLQRVVDRCRRRAAEVLGAESFQQIIFTFNATDSLNLAIHGLVQPGDHVVTSTAEHNSVLRPLRELQQYQGIEVTHVPTDRTGLIDPVSVQDALRPTTRLVVLIHASNVTGTIQPIAEVGETAHAGGAFVLVDAAQTAGHLPIDLGNLPVDLLACAGHKGLLGPLGTGLLYVRPGVEEHLRSFRQGGTGSESENDRQPSTLPDKYESGNHNAPGLCGLEAALAFLQETGVDAIHRQEQELTGRLLDDLNAINGITVFGPKDVQKQTGVISIRAEGWEPQDLATILDGSFGIQTRAGLHCAPGMHRNIGTFADGGTVRLSVGPFSTLEEIEATVAALRELTAAT